MYKNEDFPQQWADIGHKSGIYPGQILLFGTVVTQTSAPEASAKAAVQS